MGGPINGVSWKKMDESMYKNEAKDVLLGQVAEQRTQEYEQGRSHGAARFFKCIFSLGINEIWRAVNTSNYKSDMRKIAKSLQNFYTALEPKLDDTFMTAEGESSSTGSFATKIYKQVERRDVEIAGGKVHVTRNADGTGVVEIPSENDTEYIKDCDSVRSEIEMDVMRHAQFFDPKFVKKIISAQHQIITGMMANGESVDEAMRTVRKQDVPSSNQAMSATRIYIERDKSDLNAVPAAEQRMTPVTAAKQRLQKMLSAFYEGTIGLPTEVSQTLDLEIGVQFVSKVLAGEITDPDKLRAFLDKGAKKAHLANAESQKLFAQFEKAVAANHADVNKVKIDAGYVAQLEAKKSAFEPQGEAKKVHDFVADLVLNEDVYDYDKDVSQGQMTGARLNRLVEKHQKTIALLMDENNRSLLDTVAPELRKVVKEKLLDSLEKDYQKVLSTKENKASFSREAYLKDKLETLRKREANTRMVFGTRDAQTLSDVELDVLGTDSRLEDVEHLQKVKEKEVYLGCDAGRKAIQECLDFFSTIEADIDKGVQDACDGVQKSIAEKIETIFKKSEAEGGLRTDEIASKSLDEIEKAYSKEEDLELIRETLKVYFTEVPELSKRQMIAAQTRHCMMTSADGTKEATAGAKLGALLKGAGPVMQKMLQGVNPELITDPDMKIALADMKDNLEPIPEKAIQAYLYDIIRQSREDDLPIESITVKRSLGQASVGQALLCSLKRKDQTPEDVVIKLLRPNANLAARREHEIFKTVASKIKNGMEATFKGRYKSIKEELDLASEARNAQKASEIYDNRTYNGQPFTNVTSAGLAEGFKPTSNTMVQQCADGMTLKKVLTEEAADLETKNVGELKDLREKLLKTHASLTNVSYMWTQEGLFGAGFFHGDLHDGNIIVNQDGTVTLIDFGNATTLDDSGRINVIRTISGTAVSNAEIFLKGYEQLLQTDAGKKAFSDHRAEITEKINALFSDAHKGLALTPRRLNLALKILQMDFKVEVPAALHNFKESQRRLNDAMVNTEAKIRAVNEQLRLKGEAVEDEPLPTMMKCLVDVVKHNVGMTLLKSIGLSNAKAVFASIKDDLASIDQVPGKNENRIDA